MAEIQAPFSLNHTTTDPADTRALKNNLAERDAIPLTSRHPLMFCSVISEGKTYQLRGGITNSNWVEVDKDSNLNDFYFDDDLLTVGTGGTALAGSTTPVITDAAANIPVGNYLGYVYSSSGTAPSASTGIRPNIGGVIPFSLRVDKCTIKLLVRWQFQSIPVVAENFELVTGISVGGAVGADNGAAIRLVSSGGVPVFQAWNRNGVVTANPFSMTPTINTWYDCIIEIIPNTSTIVFTIFNGTTFERLEHTTNFPPAGTYQWALHQCRLASTGRATTFRTFIDYYAIRATFPTPRSAALI